MAAYEALEWVCRAVATRGSPASFADARETLAAHSLIGADVALADLADLLSGAVYRGVASVVAGGRLARSRRAVFEKSMVSMVSPATLPSCPAARV